MYQNHAEQEFSFGKISYKVSAEGSIDRPQALVDHMLATAIAVGSTEVIQYGISSSEGQRDDSKSQSSQKCISSNKFNEVTITTEISFEPKQRTSWRTLNSMVFGAILPKVLETASIYLGDNQSLTSPQSPLTSVPQREILDDLGRALGLEQRPFTVSDVIGSHNDQRSSQLVGAGAR